MRLCGRLHFDFFPDDVKRFDITDLPLAGLKLVQRHPRGDARGSLTRMFCAAELQPVWPGPIIQINHTWTAKRGTVRGLHYQHPPHCEKKIVACLRGEVWDVAVDLRAGSPTFLHWHAEVLSAANNRALLIPEGFAHGFQTLTQEVEMLYFHSSPHVGTSEGGLHPLDPKLGIHWPLGVSMLSERDASHPLLPSGFKGITI